MIKEIVFKVVEKACKYPVRFPVKPGVKLLPGDIAILVEYEGFLVCDKSDGTKPPFGIIGCRKVNNGEQISFNQKDMVKIWPQRMVFRCDRYDKSVNWTEDNRNLYVNGKGLLTPKKPNDESYHVAKLITPPGKNKFFEALWI